MKRPIGTALVAIGLGLAVACGPSGGAKEPDPNGGLGVSAEEAAAPAATVVETPTPQLTPRPAWELRERLKEMALHEGDLPPRFFLIGSRDLIDFDFELLPGPSPQQGVVHQAVFTTAGGDETIVCMVILMEGSQAVEEVFAEMDKVSAEGLQDFFDIVGDYSQGTFVTYARELDVSALGDDANGLRITLDASEAGLPSPEPDMIDEEMVAFGRGPVVGMVQTVALGGGTAVDAVLLAQKMVEKVEAVIR